jgi:cyclopropane fatty-acyl-phospholipid synthase-like methyltransferase
MTSISQEYSRYLKSSVMKTVAASALKESYKGQTSSATFEEIDSYLASYDLNPKSRILDAGCGNGCFDFDIINKYRCSVLGLDLSCDLVNEAKYLYATSNTTLLDFRQGDFMDERAYPKEVFDLILSIGSLYWGQNIFHLFDLWKKKTHQQSRLLVFTNLEYKPLSFEQQQSIGQTQFIKKSHFETCLLESGWSITQWKDRSQEYILWLEKFIAALEIHKFEILEEMSHEASCKLIERFQTYLSLAKNSQVKRIIIEAKHA